MNFSEQLTVRLSESPLWLRWQRLQPRERLSLGLLLAFLLAVVCYLLLWQPAQQRLAEARSYFEEQRQLYAYLEQNTELARRMSGTTRTLLAPDQLQGLVTQSAQQHGLRVESFDSGGDGSLQVTLPGASYAMLLQWFDQLQAAGASLAEVSISRVGDGVVDARLTVRPGA